LYQLQSQFSAPSVPVRSRLAAQRTLSLSLALYTRLCALAGERPGDAPLFATRSSKSGKRGGKPLSISNVVGRNLKPLCAALGIAPVGLHAFRHFSATVMGNLGVPIREAAERLGHSDPALTLRIYQHSVANTASKIGTQIADQLFGNVPKPVSTQVGSA